MKKSLMFMCLLASISANRGMAQAGPSGASSSQTGSSSQSETFCPCCQEPCDFEKDENAIACFYAFGTPEVPGALQHGCHLECLKKLFAHYALSKCPECRKEPLSEENRQFLIGARTGNVAMVRTALETGATLRLHHDAALTIAIRRKYNAIITFLWSQYDAKTKRNSDLASRILAYAAQNWSVKDIALLMERSSFCAEQLAMALHTATVAGRLDLVRFFVETKGIREKLDALLYIATDLDHVDIVDYLTKAPWFSHPLVVPDYKILAARAIQKGSLSVIRYLAKNKQARAELANCLTLAVDYEQTAALKYLLEDVHIESNPSSLLARAISNGRLSSTVYLLSRPDVHPDFKKILHLAANKEQITMLDHIFVNYCKSMNSNDQAISAAATGNLTLLKYFIEHHNSPPLELLKIFNTALEHEHTHIVGYFLEHHLSPINIWEILMTSIERDKTQVAFFLLEQINSSANPSAREELQARMETVFMQALTLKKDAIVRQLLAKYLDVNRLIHNAIVRKDIAFIIRLVEKYHASANYNELMHAALEHDLPEIADYFCKKQLVSAPMLLIDTLRTNRSKTLSFLLSHESIDTLTAIDWAIESGSPDMLAAIAAQSKSSHEPHLLPLSCPHLETVVDILNHNKIPVDVEGAIFAAASTHKDAIMRALVIRLQSPMQLQKMLYIAISKGLDRLVATLEEQCIQKNIAVDWAELAQQANEHLDILDYILARHTDLAINPIIGNAAQRGQLPTVDYFATRHAARVDWCNVFRIAYLSKQQTIANFVAERQLKQTDIAKLLPWATAFNHEEAIEMLTKKLQHP